MYPVPRRPKKARALLKPKLIKSFRALALASLPIAGSAFAAPSAYVANYSDNTVSVIDVASNGVTHTIPVGVGPTGVAVTPDGGRVFVANRSASDWEGTVSVIDSASNAVVATIPVPGAPYGVAVTPDGSHVYVANLHPQKISVISTQTNSVVKDIAVNIKPFQIAISPDGSTVYATCQDVCNALAAISTATNTVIGHPVVPGGAQAGLDFSPDGSKLYVSSSNSNDISVLAPATGALVSTIPVGASTGAVVVSPSGDKVYAGMSNGNVAVIATASSTVLATIPAGTLNGLRGISLTSDGAAAYVADWNAHSVSVIDTSLNTVSTTIPIGKNPYSFGKFIQQQRYAFTGFFEPVNNAPTINTMKAGAAVPVKFGLGGDKGLDILATGFPSSRQVACDGSAASSPLEETSTAGASSLQYDVTKAQYIYVWKTQKEWTNTCRQFDLRLKDGTSQKAVFHFAR